jgi:hypothetical protein
MALGDGVIDESGAFGGPRGGRTSTINGLQLPEDDEEINKMLRALVMILQDRALEPGLVDPRAILERNFPQPPAGAFRPTSGAFGQNNAIFSNVSAVPSRGDRRLANVGSVLLNTIKAMESRKKKEAAEAKSKGREKVKAGTPVLQSFGLDLGGVGS